MFTLSMGMKTTEIPGSARLQAEWLWNFKWCVCTGNHYLDGCQEAVTNCSAPLAVDYITQLNLLPFSVLHHCLIFCFWTCHWTKYEILKTGSWTLFFTIYRFSCVISVLKQRINCGSSSSTMRKKLLDSCLSDWIFAHFCGCSLSCFSFWTKQDIDVITFSRFCFPMS